MTTHYFIRIIGIGIDTFLRLILTFFSKSICVERSGSAESGSVCREWAGLRSFYHSEWTGHYSHTPMQRGEIVIVKVGNRSVKVKN